MQTAAAIKWTAIAALGFLGVYVANRAWTAGTAAATAAGDALWAVSPTNNENVLYQTANIITGGGPDTSLGSRIYDWVHPSPLTPPPPRIDYTDPAKPMTNSAGYDFTYF